MRITKKKKRLIMRMIPAAIAAVVIIAFAAALSRQHFAVLDAQGTIASQQRSLMIFAAVLSLVVILPVFALTFHIVRTYRVRKDGRQLAKRSEYAPDLDGNHRLEALWWAIPSAIILVLSVVTWQSSHNLDPYKPLASTVDRPLTIQVVALQWKWLFIYPEQQIATVNYLKIPVGTPVNFEITADAPMNSFWIPQLGGQVYAMSGMASELHLQADKAGSYRGSSANLSGEGFADMDFQAEAVYTDDFRDWVAAHRNTGPSLNGKSYTALSTPWVDSTNITYGAVEQQLFQTIMMKSMGHGMDAGGTVTSGDDPDGGGIVTDGAVTDDISTPAATSTTHTMEGMQHAR